MNLDLSKAGTVVPFRAVCEVCGEENEAMATEIRKAKLATGGMEVGAVMMPLRPLNMCDRCREVLATVMRDLLDPNSHAQQIARKAIVQVMGGG